MKYYNIEIFNKNVCLGLKKYLDKNGVTYETSGVLNGVHFEIYTDENGAKNINDTLDALFWAYE